MRRDSGASGGCARGRGCARTFVFSSEKNDHNNEKDAASWPESSYASDDASFAPGGSMWRYCKCFD